MIHPIVLVGDRAGCGTERRGTGRGMGYAGQGHRWDTARLNSGVQCRAGHRCVTLGGRRAQRRGTGGPMAMSRKEVEHTSPYPALGAQTADVGLSGSQDGDKTSSAPWPQAGRCVGNLTAHSTILRRMRGLRQASRERPRRRCGIRRCISLNCSTDRSPAPGRMRSRIHPRFKERGPLRQILWISKRCPGQHGSRDSGGQARRERVVSRGRVEGWAQ